MKFETRQGLVNAVVTELGLVSGTNVQLYTEPQIEAKLYDAFDTLASKRFWPHLTKNTTHDLDGVSGTITDTLTYVHSIEDIEWIREYPYYVEDKVIFLDGAPYVDTSIRAYDSRAWDDSDYSTKLVKFYPEDDDTSVMIRARRTPTSFDTDTSVVPMDGVLMKHFLSFMLLSTDGINAEASATELAMFEQRYADLVHAETREPSRFGRERRYRDDFTVAP